MGQSSSSSDDEPMIMREVDGRIEAVSYDDALVSIVAAKDSKTLTHLILRSLVMTRNVNSVYDAMSKIENLTTLEMPWCNITDNGARALATELPNLTTLILNNNRIGNEGTKEIAMKMTKLTRLNLACNSVGDEGAIALSSMTKLTTLDLSYNPLLRDAGAVAVSTLPNLKSLDLSMNFIGNDGAMKIAANSSKMTKLISLKLFSNSGITDWAPLISAFERHPTWFYFEADVNNNVVVRIQNEKRLREFFDSPSVTGFNVTRIGRHSDRLTDVNGPIRHTVSKFVS